jgi:hypothetical protein
MVAAKENISIFLILPHTLYQFERWTLNFVFSCSDYIFVYSGFEQSQRLAYCTSIFSISDITLGVTHHRPSEFREYRLIRRWRLTSREMRWRWTRIGRCNCDTFLWLLWLFSGRTEKKYGKYDSTCFPSWSQGEFIGGVQIGRASTVPARSVVSAFSSQVPEQFFGMTELAFL